MLHRLMMLACFAISASAAWGQQPRSLPIVKPITREILEEEEARRKAGRPEPVMEETYKAHFEAYMARLEGLFGLGSSVVSPDRDDAATLVDMLYEEMNDPHLNGRWQELVMDQIRFAACRPGASEDAIDIFRAGLLNYVANGGGKHDPVSKVELAQALAILGGSAFPECDELAARLSEEAMTWAEELRNDIFREIVSERREQLDRILKSGRQADRQTPAERDLAGSKPQQAERALRALSLGDRPTVESVEKATKLATVDFGKREINEDMISRLLIAYRSVLELREGVRKEVVQAVDQKLLWLPRDARKLTVVRHWSLWADAVTALGGVRASHALEKYVFHDTLKSEREPAVVKEIERAREGLRRSNSPKPQRPSTSQPAAPTTQPRR